MVSLIFYSEVPKGRIRKIIEYVELDTGLFGLSFGDWKPGSVGLDDKARSDNDNSDKILMTVAYTILEFLGLFPILVKSLRVEKFRLTLQSRISVMTPWF